MFERYTERARRVLFFARYEAAQLGQAVIEPEHLLLGLLREGKGTTAAVFSGAGLTVERVRAELEKTAVRDVPSGVEIPFAASTKRILVQAAVEADSLNHQHIGTEHLLLGLLHEQRSVAAGMLGRHGIVADAVRVAAAEERPRRRVREAIPPSTALRVSVSRHPGTSSRQGGQHWFLEGFSFLGALSKIYGFPVSRIDVSEALSDPRPLDFYLAHEEDTDAYSLDELMRRALVEHFDLNVAEEPRLTTTLALTAPGGTTTAARAKGGGSLGAMSVEWTSDIPPTPEAVRARVEAHIRAGGGTRPRLDTDQGAMTLSGSLSMGALCQMLEGVLGQIVVDDTGLEGTYRVELRAASAGLADVTMAIGEQLGLTLTERQREIVFLVVKQR